MRPSKGVEPVASGPASSAPARAPALSLPVESHRSASKAFALFAFFVGNEPAPDTNRLTPVHMMGAYAVQLARYTSEPFVPITIRRIADPASVAGHEYVAEVRSRIDADAEAYHLRLDLATAEDGTPRWSRRFERRIPRHLQ